MTMSFIIRPHKPLVPFYFQHYSFLLIRAISSLHFSNQSLSDILSLSNEDTFYQNNQLYLVHVLVLKFFSKMSLSDISKNSFFVTTMSST